ncbi:MAG: electron transport complex subunit RsxC, partial [Mariprofundaceae bacterium]
MPDRLLRRIGRALGLEGQGFRGGIRPEMHKLTAGMPIEDAPLAPVYIVPLKQHIGEMCAVHVRPGDQVRRGQEIAAAQGYLSVPVHAPVAGRVVKIEEHRIVHPSGLGLPCVFIEPEDEGLGEETLMPPIPDWAAREPAELRERVRMAGVVGLGGALFPTFVKLVADRSHRIGTVILNGVECEPWLTNDHRLMLEAADAITEGLAILMRIVGAERGIVAVEDNKPDAAQAMREALAARDGLRAEVRLLPTRYPQGGEKQLIQALTGHEVPAGRLPMHVGVLCQNVATTFAIREAVVEGRSLTSRVVTLSGDAMPAPGNVRVPIGMPMRFLLASRGLEDFDAVRLIHGGPMMGEIVPSPDVPLTKGSIGVLAMHVETFAEAHKPEQPCIRCGHCGEACPAGLVPNLLADFCRTDRFDRAEEYDLFDCIE